MIWILFKFELFETTGTASGTGRKVALAEILTLISVIWILKNQIFELLPVTVRFPIELRRPAVTRLKTVTFNYVVLPKSEFVWNTGTVTVCGS